MPINTSSAMPETSSVGKRLSRSSSSANGATRSCANSRTVDRTSSCSLSRSKFKCRVDVRPRSLACELAEELRGQHRGALPQVRGVLEIGEGRVDVAAIARMEWKRPGVIAAGLRRGKDLLLPALVVCEEPCVEVAEGKLHRSGECGKVEDVRRAFP